MKSKNLKRLDIARALAFVVLVGATSAADAGGAGGIVFDPTNFVQTLATATNTLQSEMLAVQSAVREVTMLENSVKNAQNTVSGLNGIGGLGATLSSLQMQFNVDSTLMSQLGGQTQFVQNVMGQFGAAGASAGSFMNWMDSLGQQAQMGQQNATSLFANYTNMVNEVQKTMAQRQAIAAQNTGALGTNDAIQATNASLDNLAEINQGTLQGIATLVRQNAYQQATQAGVQGNNRNNWSAYNNQVESDVNSAISATPKATSIMGY